MEKKEKFLTEQKKYFNLNITGNGIVDGVICCHANCPRRDVKSIGLILKILI